MSERYPAEQRTSGEDGPRPSRRIPVAVRGVRRDRPKLGVELLRTWTRQAVIDASNAKFDVHRPQVAASTWSSSKTSPKPRALTTRCGKHEEV